MTTSHLWRIFEELLRRLGKIWHGRGRGIVAVLGRKVRDWLTLILDAPVRCSIRLHVRGAEAVPLAVFTRSGRIAQSARPPARKALRYRWRRQR